MGTAGDPGVALGACAALGARPCTHAIADSAYNARELAEVGVGPVEVVPVLFEALWSVGGGCRGLGVRWVWRVVGVG
ncbi:MAG: hypothetical protein R2695_03465 [Acidimicrobiales bacterium]